MIDGKADFSAAMKAAAKSSVFSTVAPKPPKLRAIAAKSGFFRVVALMRPGYSRSWCMRMVPSMALSSTTAMIGRLYCTAVANS